MRTFARHSIRSAFIALVFGAGYLAGTLGSHPAEAQIGDLGKQMGKEMLEEAAGSGGVIGTAAKLGTTITDMEQNVTALQKNIDVLKEIKGALGG